MLVNVIRSGVVFSHDPNTCAPYRIINWSQGNDTTVVTSGIGGRLWQQAAMSAVSASAIFAPIVVLLEELLMLFGNRPVDCEFAVTHETEGEELWLLQARPLILPGISESEATQTARLESIHL